MSTIITNNTVVWFYRTYVFVFARFERQLSFTFVLQNNGRASLSVVKDKHLLFELRKSAKEYLLRFFVQI